MADHDHDHSHAHDLSEIGDAWTRDAALQVVRLVLIVVRVATVVGIIALWPDGAGLDDSVEEARALGLVTDRFEATVETVTEGPCSYSTPDDPQTCRAFTFVVHEGPDAGAIVVLPEFNLTFGTPTPVLAAGDAVVLGYEPTTDFYFYADRDRGGALIGLAVVFALVVIALARWRGLLSLVAMLGTVAILVGFVAPSVLDGNDPLLVSVVAAAAIANGMYITHGRNTTTQIALVGTLGALALTVAVSWVFFALADFSGLATEEGLTLPLVADVRLSSLLLGGAVLGALGALDDVTITQVATVAELRRSNPLLSTGELVAAGIRVGRAHIVSAVNTLLLAYAGASMPLLLLFAASNQPLGDVANSELVAVEIVRTLCGSIGLVAAVPLTTIMAAALIDPASSDPTGRAPDGDGHRDPQAGLGSAIAAVGDDEGEHQTERHADADPVGRAGRGEDRGADRRP